MNGNDLMRWVLRSPFHGILSNGMMLLTVVGHRTGRKYTTPVGYYQEQDCLWVMTNRDRTWWKNLAGGAEVRLYLKHKWVKGMAETELGPDLVKNRMLDYLSHIPRAARSLGIRIVDGNASTEDVAEAARSRLFVKIQILD